MFEIDPKAAEVVTKSPYAMGLIGSLIAAAKGMPGANFLERVINVACGTALAGAVAPGASDYFSLHTDGMRSAMAVFIGLFGLNVMAAVLTWLKTLKVADYIPWKKSDE